MTRTPPERSQVRRRSARRAGGAKPKEAAPGQAAPGGLGRRSMLLATGSAGLGAALGCRRAAEATPSQGAPSAARDRQPPAPAPRTEAVRQAFVLGSPPWRTFDPFLFCVHHEDAYPAGNQRLGPAPELLSGRNIGSDFAGRDGWSMYHGDVVPGFPRHPHRGFETVTITRRGFVDHSDSLGATARYGEGDVQWMTAGRGIVHAEMFPLLSSREHNPAELFQLWLNLPRADKFAAPHFKMMWRPAIPKRVVGAGAARVEVTVVAGELEGARPPKPPPSSWASRPESDLAIWSIRMDPHAQWELPSAAAGTDRTLYFFQGHTVDVGGRTFRAGTGLRLADRLAVPLHNGSRPAELLLLQGRPIGEPVVKHGPFVMNERQEISQAIVDYRRTQFGGWPWSKDDPVHERNSGRFALHADGRKERGA